ncbi:MAG: zeta toxin family protein [Desulfovibrio sp.]|nr:zeta toxin family protein [Desulfovibrio sp.]
MDRYLICVCGPNGAGKSTFARAVLSTLNLPIVDPDLYSSQGISEIAAGKIASRLIKDYLARGVSFIKESTLTSNFDGRIIRRARELGYAVILIYIALNSAEESILRVERRAMAGGHSIPQAIIKRRFDKSRRNLKLIRDDIDYLYLIDGSRPYPFDRDPDWAEKFWKAIQ